MFKRKFVKVTSVLTALIISSTAIAVTASAYSQSNSYSIPGNAGKLTSNCYRSTNYTQSGHTLQWTYQVSAYYAGNRTVKSIKTAWTVSCCMRNSASLTIGVSSGGVTAGASSSWQSLSKSAYWDNTNGSTNASWRSNIVITPAVNYEDDSIGTVNTASVVVQGDARRFAISAGV